MEKYTLAHMNPNLAMVAQVFPEGTVHDSGSGKSYLDVRIFRSSPPMSENILYLVREEDAARFPGGYLCQHLPGPHPRGRGPYHRARPDGCAGAGPGHGPVLPVPGAGAALG